jgi:hypothetical protein
MNRRLTGALLLVAALTASAVLATGSGLRMAGRAAVVEFPASPTVGDCLLERGGMYLAESEAPQRTSARNVTAAMPATHRAMANHVFGGSFGPCDTVGAVGGEVVAVLSATGDESTRRLTAQSSSPDCRSASLRYAGLRTQDSRFTVPGQRSDDPVNWRMSINLRSEWLLPTGFLQSAGRTWMACIVAPSEDALYHGRIAGAYGGGRLPDEFGTCWDSRTVSAAIKNLDCGSPHLAELIASGVVPDRSSITYEQMRASCEHLTGLVLGRADPTAGGALIIKTSPERMPQITSGSLSILCYVTPTGDRPLAGTLVGLGDEPLPLAG